MNKTIEKGQLVALSLKEGAAPLRCYVGEVQEVDSQGVRLTLVQWIVGTMTGYDFFVPWSELTSALVCTKDHDAQRFGDEAGKWQTQMNELSQGYNNGQKEEV